MTASFEFVGFTVYTIGSHLTSAKNANEYEWGPRRIQGQLIDIYLHLDSEAFIQALCT